MLTSTYDGFRFVTNDTVFADSIAKGHTEPYPYDIHVVRRYLDTFPKRCRRYVDVGAHIGTTIAPYSRMFSNIVGFEANPETFAVLKENIAFNNIDCCLESVGLYSHPCRGYVRQHAGGNSGCYYFQEDVTGPVECKTLDQYRFEDVDFLKIDTEGSELFILKGAEENAWNKRVKEIWKKFKNGQEKDFSSFKVFFRSFKVLRPDLYEETYKSMKAKELLLEYEDIEYPENVISYSQRKAYNKKLLKQKNNENIQ